VNYIRENWPLAVRAEIVINGNRVGYRATLWLLATADEVIQ
jgi:hypothetical protein